MSAAPQLNPILSLYACLPWGMPQADLSAVRKILTLAHIGPETAVCPELTEALGQRMRECRDFTRLRGVHAKRWTVLQMAGRSLARDAEQVTRFDLATQGRGAALLQALAGFIDEHARGALLTPGGATPSLALDAILAALTDPVCTPEPDQARSEPSGEAAANDQVPSKRRRRLAA